MAAVRVEPLAHLGLLAHMIQAFRLLSRIDARIGPDAPEAITPGDAVAGMMLHGLGFAKRPRALPPQFFANKPLDLLVRDGGQAARRKRCQLGRTLAAGQAYGWALVLRDRAFAVWGQAGLAPRCQPLDTTSFARRGAARPERDAQALPMPQGDAPDHRPAGPQAVWALLVAPAGGGPLVRKRWAGQASATPRVQDRAPAPTPRSRGAEATLYPAAPAASLAQRGLRTRLPGTRTLGAPVLRHARQGDTGHARAATTRSPGLAWGHDGRAQRWRVVSSPAALERAAARRSTAPPRAGAASAPPRLPGHAQRVETPAAAHVARAARATTWRSPQGATAAVPGHHHDASTGRPTASSPLPARAGQRPAQARPDHAQRASRQQQSACCGRGTHLDGSPWRAPEVLRADQAQAQAEGGYRFLTAPVFLVSSWLVKQPCRIPGLLMVMTGALVVYAVTQRRRRHQLAPPNETLPNQINPPTARPT